MIATLSETKRIIGISQSNTSKDDDIKFFMQIVEEDIHDICKHDFVRNIDLSNEKYIPATNTISFDSATNKILDSDSNLDDAFIAGNTIKVLNSLENDGIYLIDTVAGDGSYITIDSDYGSLTDEAAGEYISVVKLWYPKALKFAFATMVNYRLSTDSLKKVSGIDSEKIDDYSIKFNTSQKTSVGGYTQDILSSLQNYRKYYK